MPEATARIVTDAAGSAWSLRLRALLTGIIVVAAFMLLAGLALERAYRDSAVEASGERLQANIYMLMSAAEVLRPGELVMPVVLPDPGLSVPDSGILAAITDSDGALLWRSESSLVVTLIYPQAETPGQPVFGTVTTGDGASLYTLSYPVIWELESGEEYTLIFHAAEDTGQVESAVATFRDTLQLWLGGAGLLLLLLQIVLLVWVLRPLQQVAEEVGEVEGGQRDQLAGNYPRELLPLTQNLNTLLRTSHARTSRYRNALADLAHSLKTPLTVLRNSSTNALSGDTRAEFNEQLDRMDDTIGYQLQRAALSGRSPLAGPVDVAAVVQRVVASLQKVYHEKNIRFAADIESAARFIGDAGDLAELLGNLGDNACKWCETTVRISVKHQAGADGADRMALCVEDDGPGIPPSLLDAVTRRGIRADSAKPGQGIGLAIVRDIVVEAYGGELTVDKSTLGGAQVNIRI